MTGRRMQDDLGFDNAEIATLAEPTPKEMRAADERSAAHMRLLWERRRFLLLELESDEVSPAWSD